MKIKTLFTPTEVATGNSTKYLQAGRQKGKNICQ